MEVVTSVLIVDDDEIWTRTVQRSFRHCGHPCYIGGVDPVVGVERAREIKPSVVLLDVGLGNYYGPDWIRRFLEAAPGCQVVCITGDPEIGERDICLDLGAHSYIPKSSHALIVGAVRAAAAYVPPDPQKLSG